MPIRPITAARSALVVALAGLLACAVEKPDDSEIGSPEDYAALAAEAERAQTITIRGREGWLFFGPELRHIGVGPFWGEDAARVSRARKPENADPLPAILDFKRQLDTIGVELILIPVPPKSIVYADMLASNWRCCTARSKSLTSLCRLQSHPAQYVSGIPSAAILLSISHPIRCSTRCLANVRARISGPMIAL